MINLIKVLVIPNLVPNNTFKRVPHKNVCVLLKNGSYIEVIGNFHITLLKFILKF